MEIPDIIICIVLFFCLWRIIYLILRKYPIANVTTDLVLSFCYTLIMYFLTIAFALFIN
jgi:hypothetical protein